ncbi:MAG TPA: aminotransferase class I/II-fold pyridoxal phosphate-dependent enzyme [Candidatus Acidoferrales bacterium]
MSRTFSRRQFTHALGIAVGAGIAAPEVWQLSALPPRLPAGLPADTIQLNSNENPYGPSPKALEAMTRSQQVAARYPDAVETEMTQIIAEHHRVPASQVMLGCGSGELLRIAAMTFLSADKNLVVAEPTFEAVLQYTRVTAANINQVPLTSDFRHDLPAMARACNAQTGLVYLCNPNNPTGTIVSSDEQDEFFRRVPRSAMILVDEAYHHFVEDRRYTTAFDSFPAQSNLILVRTFSKIYGMAGMRLGYAVAGEDAIRRMNAHTFWNNTNAAVLAAAIASLADRQHMIQQRRLNSAARQWLYKELEKDGRRYIPSHTNFVMVDVGGDVSPVIAEFRKRKILVGRKFPSLPNWLRISLGAPKEMEAFMAGLREIIPVSSRAA